MSSSVAHKGEILKGDNMIIVDFLSLDPNAFSFGDFKLDKYKNKTIPLRYRDRILFVKFPHRTIPFGVNTKTPMIDDSKGKSDVSTKEEDATGYDIAWSLGKEYKSESSEDYAYYKKAREIDEMFVKAAMNNYKWIDQDAPENDGDKLFLRQMIAGKKDYASNAKWKGVLKWSRNKDKTINEDYPPRINATFDVVFSADKEDRDDNRRRKCVFKTSFYDSDGKPIKDVNQSNYDSVVPKFSKFSMLCKWGYLTACANWITLKSTIVQCAVIPREELTLHENFLNDGSDEEEEETNYIEESMLAPMNVSVGGGGGKKAVAIKEFMEAEDNGEEIVEEVETVVKKPLRLTTKKTG
jgi:hypothetical protein